MSGIQPFSGHSKSNIYHSYHKFCWVLSCTCVRLHHYEIYLILYLNLPTLFIPHLLLLILSTMEGIPLCRTAFAEHSVSTAIDCILDETFAEIKTRRLNHIVAHEMPEDYLKYISNVSMLLHSHREPANARLFQKTITEPAETDSYQLHNPSPQHRFMHRTQTN